MVQLLLHLRRGVDERSGVVVRRERARALETFVLQVRNDGMSAATGTVGKTFALLASDGSARHADVWPTVAHDERIAQQLVALLNPALQRWQRAFVRLTTRSPKDSAWLQARGLAVASATEAITALVDSDRVRHDLRVRQITRRPIGIVVREFVSLATGLEFRVFVFRGQPTAATRYHRDQGSAQLAAMDRNLLAHCLRQYVADAAARLPACCTVDVVLRAPGPPEVAWLIEVNAFAPIADTILFDWNDPHDRAMLLSSATFDLRL